MYGMYEGRLEISPTVIYKERKFNLHILFSANIFEHVFNWLQAMERSRLYILKSLGYTRNVYKPSVPGVLQRRQLEVVFFLVFFFFFFFQVHLVAYEHTYII